MDVCLINMPYAPVRVPSIALGILQSILAKDGFSVSSLYANISFANAIGVRDYSRLWMILRSENAIAEWTFSHLAFPDKPDNVQELIKLLDDRNSNFLNLSDPVGKLLSVRDIASRFIEEVVDRVLARNPRIIGCTSTFFQHVSSLALLKKIREAAPEIVTMMGGANCESIMGMTTHRMFDWVDYVVSGEAEDLVSDLVEKVLEYGRDIPAEHAPFGVFAPIHRQTSYPQCDKTSGTNYPRAVVKQLGQHPEPDYEDYIRTMALTPDVSSQIKTGILVEASRGCWWQKDDGCSFCGLNGSGRKFRRKPVTRILEELEVLSDRYGINRFEMVDNVMDPALMKSLIPELSRLGAPYDIFFEIRAGLDRSDFEKLREAGIIWIQPGIESLHSEVLKLINKGSQSWQNIQILKWTSQFGIRCSWILMHGFPGEDDHWYEEMAEWLPSLFHLQAPRSLTRVRYVRFSHYHSDPQKFGLNLSPAKPFSMVYPIAETDLADLVFYFDEEEQLRRQQAPFLSEFIMRPGFFRIKKLQLDWVREEESRPVPQLYLRVDSDEVVIHDNRSISKSSEYFLEGLEKDIYLMCDEAPPEKELLDKLSSKGHDIRNVMDILKYFMERSLMLHLDGRYISLALKHPVTPLRPFEDFPGGYLVPIGGSTGK